MQHGRPNAADRRCLAGRARHGAGVLRNVQHSRPERHDVKQAGKQQYHRADTARCVRGMPAPARRDRAAPRPGTTAGCGPNHLGQRDAGLRVARTGTTATNRVTSEPGTETSGAVETVPLPNVRGADAGAHDPVLSFQQQL
jgi:hypothetical protein